MKLLVHILAEAASRHGRSKDGRTGGSNCNSSHVDLFSLFTEIVRKL